MRTSRAIPVPFFLAVLLSVTPMALGGAETPTGPRLAEGQTLGYPSGPLDALFLLESPDLAAVKLLSGEVRAKAKGAMHVFPPHGWIARVDGEWLGGWRLSHPGVRVYTPLDSPPAPRSTLDDAPIGLRALQTGWENLLLFGQFDAPVSVLKEGGRIPLSGDARAPRSSPGGRGGPSRAKPYGAGFCQTSEYFLGGISVGVIMPESDGTIDTSTEDWDSTRETNVSTKIQAGFAWVASVYPFATGTPSFVYHFTTGRTDAEAQTSYEPIGRDSTDEGLWVGEVMGKLNAGAYAGYPDYLDRCRAYDNDMIAADGTSWAMTIFVADSLNDADGLFNDGFFAYAYLLGPLMIMTYTNDGWGIANMDSVVAHESGHIFSALDEYESAGVPCNEVSGYIPTENQNSNLPLACLSDVACLMRSEPLSSTQIEQYTRGQIGWVDTDTDNIPDPMDTFPETSLTPYVPDPTTVTQLTYSGSSNEVPLANQNPIWWCSPGVDVSINTIAEVQWRADGGAWQPATASDGSFDEGIEDYTFTTNPLTPGPHTIESRACNSVGNCDASPASDTVEVSPPDTDGDSIPDTTDNCPDDWNPLQEDCDRDGTGDACDLTMDCTDGNPCTDDSCTVAAGCIFTPNANPCDDADACTLGDACAGGVCSGTPKDCSDGNPCTDDNCDPASGTCSNPDNSAPCDDGNACTTADTCAGGTCGGGPPRNCDDGNLCTNDGCDPATGCTYSFNNLPCDDGDLCTLFDVCDFGVCSGSPKNCADAVACTVDSCDPATGNCLHLPDNGACGDGNPCTDDTCDVVLGCQYANNTLPCDDGDACTTADACSGGSCVGGPPPNCNDGNVCTTDSCNPATGCVNANNTLACDDGNACTTADACSGGSCVGGPPPICNDGNVCTTDSCNPATGCVYTNNTAPCSDGNACTTNDTCAGGVCVGGPPLNCGDGNVCTTDSCQPSIGCVYVNNNRLCDDGSACTTNDRCAGGVCVGGPPPNCNDSNPCTDDSCNPATGCVYSNNTLPCDDGNSCTTNDTCSGGRCVGGVPPQCDDLNPCTTDGCDPVTGCTNVNNSNPCTDSNACTLNDVCSNGSCVPGPPMDCNDGNVCTDDSCDPVTGLCDHVNNNVSCDDGNACTTGDRCNRGACVGSGLSCDDGNPCTDDTCDPVLGCAHTPNAAPCDDQNACTLGDRCQGGICMGGAPRNCDDGNICTNDSCNPGRGCVHTNNALPCDDANACTVGDRCYLGVCMGGPGPNCDDQNPCTTDGCNPASGCTHVNNSNACDDRNPCTTGDICQGGTCAGFPRNCDDRNPCTDDSCDPARGCVHVPNTAPCSDGNACTENDTCLNGSCRSGTPLVCNDGNFCTDDSCNPAVGCVFSPNTKPCDDGNSCTQNDACRNGVCIGLAPQCDDRNPCTDDTCHAVTGDCIHTNNTAPCNDGNPCTVGDACSGGACAGGAPAVCDDSNPCTDDSCDPARGCVYVPDDTNVCPDGNACTEEACVGGQCIIRPVSCDDGNFCTDDSCVPATGCLHVANTLPCDDGSVCTTGDTCTNGVCTGTSTVSCDDGNPCTDDTCDPVTGQCVYTPNTATCDDGDPCTIGDACAGGVCVGGTPDPCDDGDVCTDDHCDPVAGCVHISNNAPCDDGDPCTTGDTCLLGTCVGTVRSCDDSNPCTDDFCDPATGNCVHADNTAPCTDGNACTAGDRCSGGICVAGTPKVCDDRNVCTTDGCNGATGQCVYTPVANGTACDDGNKCNIDSCQNGRCTGGALVDCSDGNPCTADSCDPATGCVHQAIANGTSCSDGNVCNGAETCQNGVCSQGTSLVCDDRNPCTADSCDPQSGCRYTPLPDGTVCDDGNKCNTDSCRNGVCTPGLAVVCDDRNPCTSDSCVPATGCRYVPVRDGTSCGDGNRCNGDETCQLGICRSGTPVNCNDNDPCTKDSCDPATGNCRHEYDPALCNCSTCPNYDFGPFAPSTAWRTHPSSVVQDGCRLYRFDLTAGKSYRFTFCEGGGSATFDTAIDQMGGNCQWQSWNDNACGPFSRLDVVALTSGPVYVKVKGMRGAYGDYVLAYRELTGEDCVNCPAWNFGPFVPTSSYQTHSSSVGSGGCQMYLFEVVSGHRYRFTFCEGGGTAAFDTVLDLYGGGCGWKAWNDNTCGDKSQLDFSATASGVVYLRVKGAGTAAGAYSLAFRDLGP